MRKMAELGIMSLLFSLRDILYTSKYMAKAGILSRIQAVDGIHAETIHSLNLSGVGGISRTKQDEFDVHS